ncbi:hypothetical protein QMA77_06440 [Pantoea ananatis]|uniref:hypothetical protein n=1 Tax=Pantoea ananas TaxID=553 RepID=UPI0024ADB9C0|nr:hypothetical protein [Pantoea ananatis]MDI6536574.1 hypothetical protein [Pantoea ananatis]
MHKALTGYYSPLTIRVFLSSSNHMRRHFLLLYIYKQTGSISASAMVFMLEWLPKLIAFGVFPRITSAIGEKKLFAVSSLVSCICLLSLHFINFTFVYLFSLCFIISLVASFSSIYIDTASAIRKSNVRFPHLQNLMQQAEQACTLIMPVVSSYFVFSGQGMTDIGVYILFTLYALCTLTALADCVGGKYVITSKKKTNSITDGLKYLSSAPLRTYVVFSFLSLVSFSGISALLPEYLKSINASAEYNYSLVVCSASLLTMLALPIQNIILKKSGSNLSLKLLMVFYFISILLLLIPAARFSSLVIAYALMSISINALDVLFKIIRVRFIHPDDFRAAMGVFAIFMLLPIMCASVALSILGEDVSMQLLIKGLCAPAMILLAYLLISSFRTKKTAVTF